MSRPTPPRRALVTTVLASQALRGVGYGLLAVQLEQVVLASMAAPQATITRGFGVYNAVATLAGAAGALLGMLPASGRLLGGTLIVVGTGGAVLAMRLAALGIEAPRTQGEATRPLASSRGVVGRWRRCLRSTVSPAVWSSRHMWPTGWACATARPRR